MYKRLAVVALFFWGCTSTPAKQDGSDAVQEPDAANEVIGSDGTNADLGRPEGDGKGEADEAGAEVQAGADILDVAGPDLLDTTSLDIATDVPPDVLPNIEIAEDTGPLGIGPLCFPAVYEEGAKGPQYDQFNPTIGAHCYGTNHQQIVGVKEVVFIGDSVTVGTPNVAHIASFDNSHFYRNLLAEWLATKFGLETGNLWDWGIWKTYDYISGKGGSLQCGDFRHCGKWGARTDDILHGGGQVQECFPSGGHDEPTLVVISLGGNDIANITESGAEATPEEVAAGYPEAWALAETTVAYLEEAMAYFKDPANFPGGAYVIYCNGFEFTDGTGQTSSCTPQFKLDVPLIGEVDLSELAIPVALIAGYGEWAQPEVQADIVIWMLEQYMRIAVEYEVDMIWTVESFCGHGYMAAGVNADPENQCYIDSEAELYFDETCVHPSEAGHYALYEMFKAVVEE